MQLQRRNYNYWGKEWQWIISITGLLVGHKRHRSNTLKIHVYNGLPLLYISFLLDNMPVTWCYQLEDERQYCSTGFPMGCYSKESRSQQDTCTIHVSIKLSLRYHSIAKVKFINGWSFIHVQGAPYNKMDTYYLFNHVNLTITYHSGGSEEWGSAFKENGGRIICEYFRIFSKSMLFALAL